MTQQVARFLVKELSSLASGKEVSASTQYLTHLARGDSTSSYRITSPEQLSDLTVQVDLYAVRAARVAHELGVALKSGKPISDLNVECWNVSVAHTEYTVMRAFADKVEELKRSEFSPLRDTVKLLCDLVSIQLCVHSSRFHPQLRINIHRRCSLRFPISLVPHKLPSLQHRLSMPQIFVSSTTLTTVC